MTINPVGLHKPSRMVLMDNGDLVFLETLIDLGGEETEDISTAVAACGSYGNFWLTFDLDKLENIQVH